MSRRDAFTLLYMMLLSAELVVVGLSFVVGAGWVFVALMQLLVIPSTFLMTALLVGKSGNK
jgi:hypothetical protein